MSFGKRILDISVAAVLIVLLLPLIIWVAWKIYRTDGGPILYRSERMQTRQRPFLLWKFRTMTPQQGDTGVSGGHKVARVTQTGQFLRRHRLDELPQLWNILRGDISFVGPRPPLRHYVEMFPELYEAVLQSRPGLTGLATLAFHRREEALLASCQTADETEAVYCRRCVPRKASLDLLYASRRTICSDIRLMFITILPGVELR